MISEIPSESGVFVQPQDFLNIRIRKMLFLRQELYESAESIMFGIPVIRFTIFLPLLFQGVIVDHSKIHPTVCVSQ